MSAGRFVQGQSGNPKGRRVNPFAKHRDALAAKLIEAAMQGNLDCLQTAVALAFQSSRQMTAKHGGHQV